MGEDRVIDWISGCVAFAVDGIGRFLAFFTKGGEGGSLVESDLCMLRSETALMT